MKAIFFWIGTLPVALTYSCNTKAKSESDTSAKTKTKGEEYKEKNRNNTVKRATAVT